MASSTLPSRFRASLSKLSEVYTSPKPSPCSLLRAANLCNSSSPFPSTSSSSPSPSSSSSGVTYYPYVDNAEAAEYPEKPYSTPSSPPPPPPPPPSDYSAGSSSASGRFSPRVLENGMDTGIYKAILVGQVGQSPVQKTLRSGRVVTLFSLGTGGIRNNRRPFESENPMEYAERCSVQWHRACVYMEPLGKIAMQHLQPGSIVYVEGNLETKIFNDQVTGLPKRIREIAIRRDAGRLVFLGKGGDSEQPIQANLRGVGYF